MRIIHRMSAPPLKRWEILPSTGSHFDVLDGLRGVAILLVVSFHAFYVNPSAGVWAKFLNWTVIQPGWMGVPIFFVLSGFLISYPLFLGRAKDSQFWYQRGYASRRLGKILPPFYLSIVLFLGCYWLQYHDPAYFISAAKWALGLGSFVSITPAFNGSYWSLMVESQFYLLLPIFFGLTRGLSVLPTGGIIFSVFFLVPLLVRQFMWPTGVNALPDFTDPQNGQIMFNLTRFPCRLDYFAWGMLFAAIFVSLPKNKEAFKPLSFFGYAGAALMFITLFFWGKWCDEFSLKPHETRWAVEFAHLLPAAATMLMLFFVFNPQSLGARILSMGWLRFMGIVSYEWFLFHLPVVNWFKEHYTGPTHGNAFAYLWKIGAPVVLTFIFAVIVYRYFSLPILNHIRDRLKTDASR